MNILLIYIFLLFFFFIIYQIILKKHIKLSSNQFLISIFLYAFINTIFYLNSNLDFCTLIFSTILFISSITDIKKLFVPDCFIYIGFLIILILKFILKSNFIFSLFSSIISFCLLYIIYLISNKNIGGADVKIYLLIGLFLGLNRAILSLFYSCFLATIFFFLFNRNKNKEIAMIPYITLACYFLILNPNLSII